MYSNNTEYRDCLRKYFQMDISGKAKEYADVDDPESYDELLYDDDAMKRGMDTILDKTRENPLFIHLYTLAAGRFLTDDIEIGLCVLLSYDYFADFIPVFETADLSEYTECYLHLKRKLS
jgi:hypothetical protein